MAVAIFAAATLRVCASGRCRGLGAGRRRALTIHEPRASIGRRRGGARQGPPPCFRPAALARRRCGVCPEGIRASDGICTLQCGSYLSFPSSFPSRGGFLLNAWPGAPFARVCWLQASPSSRQPRLGPRCSHVGSGQAVSRLVLPEVSPGCVGLQKRDTPTPPHLHPHPHRHCLTLMLFVAVLSRGGVPALYRGAFTRTS